MTSDFEYIINRTARDLKSKITKMKLIDAAWKLLHERGADKLTVRAVCAAAGVSTGAFYYYFTTKNELLPPRHVSIDMYVKKMLSIAHVSRGIGMLCGLSAK